jgi:o-succinylbenzoate synthase
VSEVRVRATPFRLPLRAPLRTGSGVLRERLGLLVCVEDPDGWRGWGEATPVPGFAEPGLVEAGAIEAARLDYRARREGPPLAQLFAARLGTRGRERVEVNALLSGDEPQELAAHALAAWKAGFRTLKVKVGAASAARDLQRVAAAREAAGPDARLRVDANGSLEESAALALARQLADLNIEYLEQPVAASDLDALRRLRAASPVPIAADEAASTGFGARAVIERGAADVLVLKPSLLGPGAALEIARSAHDAGLVVVVSSALDGAIGRALSLHVAAALPEPLPACGLATDEYLADDIARLSGPRAGWLALPTDPGLGIDPDPAAVERLRSGPDRELRP